MSFSTKKSRMYAALRCIEVELKKRAPSIEKIREIMSEAGRNLGPVHNKQLHPTEKNG